MYVSILPTKEKCASSTRRTTMDWKWPSFFKGVDMFNKMKCRRNCGNSRFSFGSARTCIHLESNPLQFGRHYQLGCRLLLPDWHWRTGSWSISIWNCSSIATLKQTTFVPSLRESPSRGISCWSRNPNSTVVCSTPMFDTVRQIKHVLCKTVSISNLKYVFFCWFYYYYSHRMKRSNSKPHLLGVS
jgi:hypothetical protein